MKLTLAKLASVVLALAVVCAWATPVFPQEPAKNPAIKRTVAPQTPADSGPVMYNAYCAACHGVRGDGNGPAATALKTPPPDLTTLAKRHKGEYPSHEVQQVLKHGIEYAAHGTSDMPVWGPTFRALNSDTDIVTLRIANLTDYIKTMQKK